MKQTIVHTSFKQVGICLKSLTIISSKFEVMSQDSKRFVIVRWILGIVLGKSYVAHLMNIVKYVHMQSNCFDSCTWCLCTMHAYVVAVPQTSLMAITFHTVYRCVQTIVCKPIHDYSRQNSQFKMPLVVRSACATCTEPTKKGYMPFNKK